MADNRDVTPSEVFKPVRCGTILPTTCKIGEIYFLVGAVPAIYGSFAVDTWTQIYNVNGAVGNIVGNVTGNVTGNTNGAVVASSIIITDTAVADGDLAANQLAIFVDPTNGAGKLKIKAKTANGTVASGSVDLT